MISWHDWLIAFNIERKNKVHVENPGDMCFSVWIFGDDSSGWTEEHPSFLSALEYRAANNKDIPPYAVTNAICDQGTLSDSVLRIQISYIIYIGSAWESKVAVEEVWWSI